MSATTDILIVKTRVEYKQLCPYGIWTCDDGREVLFNRDYCPVLERKDDGPARPANMGAWINWKKQSWFFNDGNPPWRGKGKEDTLARINAVLKEWGVPQLPKVPRRLGTRNNQIIFHSAEFARQFTPPTNPWDAILGDDLPGL